MRKILILIMLMIAPTLYAGETKQANVMIFVSFSMPLESIKGWMLEAEKIHAPVLIRGLFQNSFKATFYKMRALVADNHGGIQIDPNEFRRYQIKQVPAVVVTDKLNCLPTQSCREHYAVVYGNVHLDYALNKMADQNDDGISTIAKEALVRLREKNHA